MKDAYSFDLDQAGAQHSYNRMFVAYLRTFARLGLKAIPMRAETGPIGGDLSHEFIILAETGESEVFCHKDYLDMAVPGDDVDFDDVAGLQPIVDQWTSLYAATDEMHEPDTFDGHPRADRPVSARGIEVGHIFYFGTKYSAPMKAVVATGEGGEVAGAHGLLRHRAEPAGGRHHRGQPRRCRHRLAGGGGAVQGGAAQSASRARPRPTPPATSSTRRSPPRASRCSTTTATSAPAASSPPPT